MNDPAARPSVSSGRCNVLTEFSKSVHDRDELLRWLDEGKSKGKGKRRLKLKVAVVPPREIAFVENGYGSDLYHVAPEFLRHAVAREIERRAESIIKAVCERELKRLNAEIKEYRVEALEYLRAAEKQIRNELKGQA